MNMPIDNSHSLEDEIEHLGLECLWWIGKLSSARVAYANCKTHIPTYL